MPGFWHPARELHRVTESRNPADWLKDVDIQVQSSLRCIDLEILAGRRQDSQTQPRDWASRNVENPFRPPANHAIMEVSLKALRNHILSSVPFPGVLLLHACNVPPILQCHFCCVLAMPAVWRNCAKQRRLLGNRIGGRITGRIRNLSLG